MDTQPVENTEIHLSKEEYKERMTRIAQYFDFPDEPEFWPVDFLHGCLAFELDNGPEALAREIHRGHTKH